jgi:twinkle protein
MPQSTKPLSEFGIDVPAGASGHYRTTCPQCSKDRRKANVKCLSVNISEGMWYCHHCFWKGSTKGHTFDEVVEHFERPRFTKTNLPADAVKWFEKRGIPVEVLVEEGISWGAKKDLQFPYHKDGEVVNIKHRTLEKVFWQEKGAETCFYRHDEISKLSSDTLIITEGEIDALSLLVAKFSMVTSIPDGAPSADSKTFQTKFDFMERAQGILDAYDKIVIAVDNDGPGRRLEQELVRRIGAERCLKVEWPEGCKDANDVLVKRGWEPLRALILSAKPYPVEGLFQCLDFSREVECLYDKGEQRGLSTGMPGLDELYTVRPAEFSVITGIPAHGKSNVMDFIAVRMAQQHGWKFLFFSPENWPVERHIQSLLEKSLGKPFSRPKAMQDRMTRDQMKSGMKWLQQHFHFLYPESGTFSLDTILVKARAAVLRYGVHGIVIDPWNELDHNFENLSEAQYLSRELSKLRQFARRNGVHVWVIAHPRNLIKQNGIYQPPTMYEISGGAHWRNKADNGLCVFRENFENNQTKIIVQKIRFREVGKPGEATVSYRHDDTTYY